MARYVYDKLPERHIRILWLSAGRENEPLRGKLEAGSINHFAEFASLARFEQTQRIGDKHDWFEALSYYWGSGDMPFVLETSEGAIPITASLDSSLRRLRLPDVNRPLWADAVCINQQDSSEKEQQVPLMGEIYSRAAKVLVDLSNARPGSSEALEIIDLY